jgi:quaternary ammonium compound-resistance protein SugE
MAWICLLIAALFEVIWAVGLKSTVGLTRLWPSVFTVLASIVSFVLLAQATKTLPVGTSYAIWTGIGAAGTATLGILWFGESASLARVICIALIVVGVVGLKLTASDQLAAKTPADAVQAESLKEPRY